MNQKIKKIISEEIKKAFHGDDKNKNIIVDDQQFKEFSGSSVGAGVTLPLGRKIDESIYEGACLDDGTLVCEACLAEIIETAYLSEAKYHGRSVKLNKPMKGDIKKFKVYVKDPATGNVKKVNYGDPNMRIKKSNPARRKSFRARHRCATPGPKTKARYWSCKKW